ncbi:MAG: hypothetical protein RLZZ303_3298 [Candidatus Hydrogenedentota bacterium]
MKHDVSCPPAREDACDDPSHVARVRGDESSRSKERWDRSVSVIGAVFCHLVALFALAWLAPTQRQVEPEYIHVALLGGPLSEVDSIAPPLPADAHETPPTPESGYPVSELTVEPDPAELHSPMTETRGTPAEQPRMTSPSPESQPRTKSPKLKPKPEPPAKAKAASPSSHENVAAAPAKPPRPTEGSGATDEPAETSSPSSVSAESESESVLAAKTPPPSRITRAAPDYLRSPQPEYPLSARRRKQQGVVLLLVDVTSQGKASRVIVKKSSGVESLDLAAIEAVRGWDFHPARDGGTAVPAEIEVPIRFVLSE